MYTPRKRGRLGRLDGYRRDAIGGPFNEHVEPKRLEVDSKRPRVVAIVRGCRRRGHGRRDCRFRSRRCRIGGNETIGNADSHCAVIVSVDNCPFDRRGVGAEEGA